MTVLVDGNVLIAVTISSHVPHRSAAQWWAGLGAPYTRSVLAEVTGHADVTDA